MTKRSVAPESELLRIFHAAYEEGNRAWNAGDFRRAYGGLPHDFEYHLAPTWPNARPLRGPDEIATFFEEAHDLLPDMQGEIREVTQLGEETILTGLEWKGTGRRSGAGAAMKIWQVWEMDLAERRPVRVTEFADREAAIEAARVEEPAKARADGEGR